MTAHLPAICPECEAGRLAAPRASLLRGIVDDAFALAIVLGSLAACAILAAIVVAVLAVLA